MIKYNKIKKALNNSVSYTRDWQEDLFLNYKEPYPCYGSPKKCINTGNIYMVLENKEFHFGLFCDECAKEWVSGYSRSLIKLE